MIRYFVLIPLFLRLYKPFDYTISRDRLMIYKPYRYNESEWELMMKFGDLS